ncbi:MAG TPA: VOC family protein [Gammaproteobacteria bacterium]|nr:VOC family protein [Gammaproteobacteria bacterium]
MVRLRCAFALLIAFAASAAQADVSLNSVRIAAKDAEALGKFYAAAFGLHETNRLQTQNGPELFLNFGANAEAARANQSPAVVIMQTKEGPVNDPVMHVILTVTDAAATAAAAKAAGGTVAREAAQFSNSGIFIAFVVDPEGNRIELIQPARR